MDKRLEWGTIIYVDIGGIVGNTKGTGGSSMGGGDT
jgi:hypothetical protein